MNLESLVGETLDGKYKIEKELGRGGMGAVYLATHLGTERPVALKVIVQQFMQRVEFVERFRREARAAGRLRHPNVVDVTDFGFSDTEGGRVAYLVMEYLDGCTLGEILEEEKKLPLQWTLDILEQVGSAIHEAHEQGIIHRDLKPDNIWLEPNQRGGYTVKVLDFGIAKLEAVGEHHAGEPGHSPQLASGLTQEIFLNDTNADAYPSPTISEKGNSTAAVSEGQTISDSRNSKTFAAEAGTLIQPLAQIDSEGGTAIMPQSETAKPDNTGTKILTPPPQKTSHAASAETGMLTRVGAVLGTPLYMSPEQCRGEHLDARSDIYSLAVIAYQMLSGKTPFDGDFKSVMQSHKEAAPPALDVKKVPSKVKRTIMTALSKNAADRPQTAQTFTNELRAQSEGFGILLQRALIIYSEHLPKFLTLSVLAYLPVAVVSILQFAISFLSGIGVIGGVLNVASKIILTLASFFFGLFCGYIILGTTTWIVTQILAMPLRPVSLRAAFREFAKKWKSLVVTGTISSVLTIVGLFFCLLPILPGLYLAVSWALISPVIMMENLRGKAAMKRSKELTRRSLRTTTATVITMFLVPLLVASIVAFVASATVKSFAGTPPKTVTKTIDESEQNTDRAINFKTDTKGNGIQFNLGDDDEKLDKNDMGGHLRMAVREALMEILMLPLSIFFSSFSAIIVALLYLKTRQAGGESMQDLLAQFEEADQPHSNWQKRVRDRLIQSGRVTSKPASSAERLSAERQSKSRESASE